MAVAQEAMNKSMKLKAPRRTYASAASGCRSPDDSSQKIKVSEQPYQKNKIRPNQVNRRNAPRVLLAHYGELSHFFAARHSHPSASGREPTGSFRLKLGG
jgi:hypothetical protein